MIEGDGFIFIRESYLRYFSVFIRDSFHWKVLGEMSFGREMRSVVVVMEGD